MAGTSWDKLGQMDAAFEEIAPTIRAVAQEANVKLHEFFRDDPLWRLDFAREAGGEAVVDVAWSEDRPDVFTIAASWWVDDYDTTMRKLHREEIGVFQRNQAAERVASEDVRTTRLQIPDRAKIKFGHIFDARQRFVQPIDSSRLHPIDRVVRFDVLNRLKEVHNAATQAMGNKNRRLLSARLQQY